MDISFCLDNGLANTAEARMPNIRKGNRLPIIVFSLLSSLKRIKEKTGWRGIYYKQNCLWWWQVLFVLGNSGVIIRFRHTKRSLSFRYFEFGYAGDWLLNDTKYIEKTINNS